MTDCAGWNSFDQGIHLSLLVGHDGPRPELKR